MNWIKVEEQLPEVDASGESGYVLAYSGYGVIPQVVKYANGDWSRRGWKTPRFEHYPIFSGKGKNRRLTFKYWTKIKLPKE